MILNYTDKFDIKGRGKVFIASMKAHPNLRSAKEVTIDGVTHVVTAIEGSDKNGIISDSVGVIAYPKPQQVTI